MTRQFLMTAAVCLMSLIPAFAASKAQMRLTLPYGITVGNQLLPAGQYTVEDLQDDGGAAIFLLRSQQTGKAVDIMSQTSATDGKRDAFSVTLNKVGESYFINKIEMGGRVYTF